MSDKTTPENGEQPVDYSKTLNLPVTDFPMRGGLPKREPEWLARWEKMDLYKLQREDAKDREKFTLHDGPPYANGNIHIGHALNKTLKDIIVRSHQMQGYNAAYVPGWDCHGLPIEWKIEEQYRAKGKNKDEVPINEFRLECREFAQGWVDIQREEFKRLGVGGDWDNPYLTMTFEAEAQIARELMKFSMSGQLYRGSKPIMWSVVERTALAEAEIEYHDYQSDEIWVKFPVRSVFTFPQGGKTVEEAKQKVLEKRSFLDSASIVIWTTTPWTIPANRAISFSPKINYALYEVTAAENDFGPQPGEILIFAESLAPVCAEKAKISLERKFAIPEETLKGFICDHPLKAFNDGYDFGVPLIAGDHVSAEAGTGFVHTAPGHGRDDFEAWMSNAKTIEARGISTTIPFCVDDGGYYTKDVPGLGPDATEGAARILDDKGKKGDANDRVIKALIGTNTLFARGRLKHSYPHSWRSKKPIIYRNTPQWFVYMDKPLEGGEGDTLRSRALNAIDATRFVPAQGQNRLRAMIEQRPDWVLSRQRAWGVPIAVFFHKETGEVLKDETVNKRITDAFEIEGADAWFAKGAAERFLDGAYSSDEWEQVSDILDVWFDSGSTHSYVLEKRPDLKWPADVYLEGTDQHRGWFHSSLLESCGTRGRAPYDQVVTNGFTMDAKGNKMSKSVGNTIAPQDIIKQYGADILRLWVASVDYWTDHRIGDEILKTSIDAYRKMRNTLRWLLGNLAYYDETDSVADKDMPELERYILHRISEVDRQVRQAYHDYEFKEVFSTIFNFMSSDLSAFYFDIRKDALYCDPKSSTTRKAALRMLNHLYYCLTAWLAPILVFTMEEVWLERHGQDGSSVHLRQFPTIPTEWRDDELAKKWTDIRKVRRVVTGALEIERRDKNIGSSLESAPDIYVSDTGLIVALEGIDLAEISITSGATLHQNEGPASAFRLDEVAGVSVAHKQAGGKKCARSWKFSADVGSDPDYPDVTTRDAKALRELRESGV